jgi:hypothetical protein
LCQTAFHQLCQTAFHQHHPSALAQAAFCQHPPPTHSMALAKQKVVHVARSVPPTPHKARVVHVASSNVSQAPSTLVITIRVPTFPRGFKIRKALKFAKLLHRRY